MTFFTNISSFIFAFFGIIAGCSTQWLLNSLGFNFIPYAVFVFIEGFIFAIIQVRFFSSSTFLIEYDAIGADCIVYVFLPILLFSEVKSLNWYRVLSCFKQSFILAGPGSIITCFSIAGFTKLILPDWSWSFVLLFGSVLSTTDPVSIVSLLKTSGASNKLTTVIVGESLMNDGVGMILFFYFYRILQYSEGYDFRSLLFFIFRMLVLSPLYGGVVGFFGVTCIEKLHKKNLVKNINFYICITIVMTYVSFYFAQNENMLHCSGVLSCCTAGIIFSWLGSPYISFHHQMIQAWELLEWICNTLIFLLSGIIAGRIMQPLMNSSTFGVLFLIYVTLNFIRLFMIFVLMPLIKRFAGNGLNISVNDSFFIAWGGVRGALGISLALIVLTCIEGFEGCSYNPDLVKQGDLFFFYVGGVSGLTLLINGSLGPFVLKYLKLTPESDEVKSAGYKYMVNKVVMSLSDTVTMESINDEIGSFDFDESEIFRLCKLNLNNNNNNSQKDDTISMSDNTSEIDLHVLEYLSTSFLTTIKARYTFLVNSERIGSHINVGNLLIFTVDFALDKLTISLDEKVLTDWKYLQEYLNHNETIASIFEILDKIKEKFGFQKTYVKNYNKYTIRKTMYALINFIDAHTFAQKKLKLFLDSTKLYIPEFNILIDDSNKSIAKAKNVLDSLDHKYVRSVYSKIAARYVLQQQNNYALDLLEKGVITDDVYSLVKESINKNKSRIDSENVILHRKSILVTENMELSFNPIYKSNK